MDILTICNAGKDIRETNYFETQAAQAGLCLLSGNESCLRLLIPAKNGMQDEFRREVVGNEIIVITRAPWPQIGGRDGYEIMFDDGSDSPFSIWLDERQVLCGSFDYRSHHGVTEFAVWIGEPLSCIFRAKAGLRIGKRLPCLKPWGGPPMTRVRANGSDTKEESKGEEMKAKKIREVTISHCGDQVLCDLCCEDFSGSNETGGGIIGRTAICPHCMPQVVRNAIKYGEYHFLRPCPEGKKFSDWILELRDGDDRIIFESF